MLDADRLAVEPHRGAVVDRLEAERPLERRVRVRELEVLAVPADPAAHRLVGGVAQVPHVRDLDLRPSGGRRRAHPALLDPLVFVVEPEQPVPVEQVPALGAVLVEGLLVRLLGARRGRQGHEQRERGQEESQRSTHHGQSQHGLRRIVGSARATRLVADRRGDREQLDSRAAQRPVAAHAHALHDRQARRSGAPRDAAGAGRVASAAAGSTACTAGSRRPPGA